MGKSLRKTVILQQISRTCRKRNRPSPLKSVSISAENEENPKRVIGNANITEVNLVR
jgi:hypothetical protein